MKGQIKQVLVICTRRIGDVVLATPLVQSLVRGITGVAVDMLVFEGTQDVVLQNPDVRKVWTVTERPGFLEHVFLLRSLLRKYDLALSVQTGDRPTFYCWVAGRYRIGTLLTDKKSRWKRCLLNQWVPLDNFNTHTVAMNLRLLEPLQIKPVATPVVSWRREDEEAARRVFPHVEGPKRYAVLHVTPKFVYKTWTVTGWGALGQWLVDHDLAVAVTGGASPEEQAYLKDVITAMPAGFINLAGRVNVPSLGYLLSRTSLYVGTDTAVSHMAAAVGVPTIVLFGPSNPIKWGPWPKDFPADAPSPWTTHGSQRQGNVFLVQGEGDCVPCFSEGCERHVRSLSDCLQKLSASRVMQAAELMLANGNDRMCRTIARVPSGAPGL
jgi:heptosyltransferase-3